MAERLTATAPGRQRLRGLTEGQALDVVLACIRAELDGSGALRDLLAKGHGRLTLEAVVRDGYVVGVDKGYSTSERYSGFTAKVTNPVS